MFDFLSGMAAAGFLIAALFFFRFWKRTKDILFVNFGIAFVLLAVSQATSSLFNAHDDRTWIYLLRLAAFILLLVAIIRKNLNTSN
jgi:membrane-associated PAP2 superfamily phosphatase